jgi:hypothetical protein
MWAQFTSAVWKPTPDRLHGTTISQKEFSPRSTLRYLKNTKVHFGGKTGKFRFFGGKTGKFRFFGGKTEKVHFGGKNQHYQFWRET